MSELVGLGPLVYRHGSVDEDMHGVVGRRANVSTCVLQISATSSCLGLCVLPKGIVGISAWIWLDGWVCFSKSCRTTLGS